MAKVSKSVEVRCDVCGGKVNYPGMLKDVEAEEWYRQNWRSTGAHSYIPKQWFCSMECEHAVSGVNQRPAPLAALAASKAERERKRHANGTV